MQGLLPGVVRCAVESQTGVSGSCAAHHSHRKALPNHSLNRTRYGRYRWPGRRSTVHFHKMGQVAPPPRAGSLERHAA